VRVRLGEFRLEGVGRRSKVTHQTELGLQCADEIAKEIKELNLKYLIRSRKRSKSMAEKLWLRAWWWCGAETTGSSVKISRGPILKKRQRNQQRGPEVTGERDWSASPP
jgi:hypothetical protein